METQAPNLDISDFLLKGYLGGMICLKAPFEPIRKHFRSKRLTYQEGDIPALFRIEYSKLYLEVAVLDQQILSISTKLTDVIGVRLVFEGFGTLDKQTDFYEFARFLNRKGIDWCIDDVESREKNIGIRFPSLTSIIFGFEGNSCRAFQIVAMDWKHYNQEIAKQVSELPHG